jgi:hypothetical protein
VADRVELALRRDGWRVRREADGAGVASDGHAVAHLVFGGLTPMHRLRWDVVVDAAGVATVTLERMVDGTFGGAIGRRRVRARFERAVEAVRVLLDEQAARSGVVVPESAVG